ncbi:MAG: cold shock domain-containing protein [Phormidesmis sp.]
MTWLLNRLQKVLGTLSGQRSGKRVISPDTAELDPSSTPSAGTDASEVAIAERLPFVPPEAVTSPQETEALPIAISKRKDVVAVQNADIEPSKEPTTHQQLDVASASVPGVVEAKPSFPTEVSELLSSTSPQSNPDVPVHPLKKLPDEELPVIHDLLPAVASPDLEHTTADAVDLDNDSELLEDADSENDSADKPVLFSFDIVESKVDDASELSDSPVETEPLASDRLAAVEISLLETLDAASSLPLERGSDEAAERIIDRSKLEVEDVTPVFPQETSVQDSRQIEGSLSEEPSQSVDFSARQSASGVPAVANPLESKADEASDAFIGIGPTSSQSLAEVAARQNEQQETEAVVAEHSTGLYPVKNGTVKLLFTMKKGNFHGYIAPDDGSKDILFHQKYINADIFEQIERGDQVAATVKYIEGKAYATHVDLR